MRGHGARIALGLLGPALLLAAPAAAQELDAPPVAEGAPGTNYGAITLGRVIASVQEHHPKVRAALANERVAEAQLGAARGAFDPYLSVYGALRHGGYYELRRVDAEVRAPTPLWGAEVWAGYRVGQGIEESRYPTYYDDQTLDRGELRAGVRVPLWRDGPLDYRRAGRQQAEHRRGAAREDREMTELELQQKATGAYWSWVAAGQAYAVSEELLELAQQRQAQVERRAEAGAIPPVDALEGRRSLLSRQRYLVAARRKVEASALVLGLFLRDEAGDPAPPGLDRLPEVLPTPEPVGDPSAAFEQVRGCHPSLEAPRAYLEYQRVARDLARARRGPQLDVRMQVSRDFGEGDTSLPGTVYEAGLVFSMPLALRTARGNLEAAEAEVASQTQDLRLLEDTLLTELRDAASAYEAAAERYRILQELADTTRQLAEAERRRFDAGATSLLVVNMREQSVGEAAMSVVSAASELWYARARWDALTRCEVAASGGVAPAEP